MDASAFRLPEDALDIDLDRRGDRDAESRPAEKPAISRFLEHGTQFAHDLAQRGAGFFLVRPAPQQADQPFPALVFGLGQGEIAQDGAGLLGSKLDRPALELTVRRPNQRIESRAAPPVLSQPTLQRRQPAASQKVPLG